MRSAVRRKVNVLDMKCLRSFVGVSRMDRVRNEEEHKKARIERELATRADPQKARRYWYNIVPITYQVYVVFGWKRVFIRYLISPRDLHSGPIHGILLARSRRLVRPTPE